MAKGLIRPNNPCLTVHVHLPVCERCSLYIRYLATIGNQPTIRPFDMNSPLHLQVHILWSV